MTRLGEEEKKHLCEKGCAGGETDPRNHTKDRGKEGKGNGKKEPPTQARPASSSIVKEKRETHIRHPKLHHKAGWTST